MDREAIGRSQGPSGASRPEAPRGGPPLKPGQKQLLGHSSIKTTTIYLHLVQKRITELKSPLDYLFPETEGGNEKQ